MKENYFDPANGPEDFSDYPPPVEELVRIHMGKHKNGYKLNINDFIAIMTILSEKTIDDEPTSEKNKKILFDAIEIFGHIRDEYGAKTGEEALNLIENRKIDQETIKKWVLQGMASETDIKKSIKIGYSEFKDDLKGK